MEDMLPETEAPGRGLGGGGEAAVALGALLVEHRGGDVLVLDLREMNAWTDFFVIATASSGAHLEGMERHLKEFCREQGLEILRRSRKPPAEDDEWRLIDLGPAVIHLMSSRARAFYELERLWAAPVIYSSNSS
jgi:ribosome-associated protein